jgi:hypothetical protein
MINWREDFVGSTRVWKTVLDGVPLDRTSIESAFKLVWVDGARKIAPFYVRKEWNTIRAELLEESGRVRVYPYKFHDQALAIAGFEIFIPSLKEFIRVNNSEETPEAEEQLEKVINKVAWGIVNAADTKLCEIFSRPSVRIDICFSGDDESIITRAIHY